MALMAWVRCSRCASSWLWDWDCGPRVGEQVMLTAVEGGGEGVLVNVIVRLRVGVCAEVGVGKLREVEETGEVDKEREEWSGEVETRRGGGMVKGSIVRRARRASCSWFRRRYLLSAED